MYQNRPGPDDQHSMDVSFNNVLEGTRQYFLGLPKQSSGQDEGGQPVWPAGAPPPEEGAPAQSGAPAPSSRPPSAAAASSAPPRPPSEPLEPEPHIIHKATVMREAAEKRRELKEPDDEEDANSALSPPTHIIHKPAPRAMISPAPAPAAPSPSPARPPSAAPPPAAPEPAPHPPAHYRSPAPSMHTPVPRPLENFAPGRPPDPYSVSRPPEHYSRYNYDPSLIDSSRRAHGSTPNSVQLAQATPARASPQSYSRISSVMPQNSSARLRDISSSSPSSQQRYLLPAQPAPPPPHNDRVPPIHHPPPVQQQLQRAPVDNRTAQMYVTNHQRRETSPYARPGPHYERHTAAPPRKYDHQQGYPGYRPTTIPPSQPPQPPPPPQRVETHQQYKRSTLEAVSTNYISRPSERIPVPQAYNADISRIPPRAEYNNTTVMNPDVQTGHHYPSTSTSTLSSRMPHRPVATPKSNYEYANSSHTPVVPLQAVRSTVKPGFTNQQARMTVSVTSLVNQMNQTKQKRESPLDLSVKTVKNSADSSTTQDDLVDSVSVESKTLLQPRVTPSGRHIPQPPGVAYVESHKVDFAPDFTQYRERNSSHNYPTTSQTSHLPVRYNGAYDVRRQGVENYTESRHQLYLDRYKYNAQPGRPEHVPRIDLTKSEERHAESKIRDDRNFIIEERKRPGSQNISNIPEKIVRYETWTADSRIDRLSQSAREQHELMSRPVYSYSSHKQFEAYQNEQKKAMPSNIYREHYPAANQRHSGSLYPTESPNSTDYHGHYPERISSSSSRHVIQKTPNQRDLQQHHFDHHNGIPADKRVLSLLRNSLETKQTGFSEPTRTPKQIPELIVIDDADDAVIEITDLTKDSESEIPHRHLKLPSKPIGQSIDHHIRMPRAVDSIADIENPKVEGVVDQKSKSPENDVASRIRTKAELKVMPPSSEHCHSADIKLNVNSSGLVKVLPKSQKQHLFNQIRQDNLRLESVIKHETPSEVVPEVKTEPLFIDEVEKDAALLLKTESVLDSIVPEETDNCRKAEMDLDWANACDNFMEQLKTDCHKKKSCKRVQTVETQENEDNLMKHDTNTFSSMDRDDQSQSSPSILNIKQEPLDDYESMNKDEFLVINQDEFIPLPYTDKNIESINDNNKKTLNEVSDIKTVSEKEDESKEKVIKSEHVLKNKTRDKERKKSLTDVNKNTKDKKSEKDKSKNKEVSMKGGRSSRETSKNESPKSKSEVNHKKLKRKSEANVKVKIEKSDSEASTSVPQATKNKQIKNEHEKLKTVIKEELESTDDDEPLIKSKLLKDKEKSDQLKFQLLKDLSEKSAYVKLECFEVDVNKNTRISVESLSKEKEEKSKGKTTRQSSRCKNKSLSQSTDKLKVEKLDDCSSDSDDELTVATRLRLRKNVKTEETKPAQVSKTPSKSSSLRKHEHNSSSNCSTPARKPGFGDASYFHPGWEEELYRYKRSLRMPPRLIAIPRGGSGGPPTKGSGSLFNRGSTSLPDLDPAPLSPAPSSAPSAATDDLYTRRQEKLNIDSDVESNSSYSTPFKLQYDSEASTSTVFSTSNKLIKKKSSSIVDVLIQKCGKREEMLKKKNKEKEDKSPKVVAKSTSDLLPTPSVTSKSGNKENLTIKKEKERVLGLGVIKKEANTDLKDSKANKIGSTPSKSKAENKTSKQRASISEVFGSNEKKAAVVDDDSPETEEEPLAKVKKDAENKCKVKKKLLKDKFKRKVNPMRDGLRSCSLKRSDAKGRMLRLKKRNSLMQSLGTKRLKGIAINKPKTEKSPSLDDADKCKDDGIPGTTDGNPKRRFKRLFGRRKFSSGFDYIRKKKKIIRKDEATNKIRRPVVKQTPESEHDIHKEIKGWFVNKSVGETHLHRAARLGYTDCVAYCLEKMEADPSAKDNAGFTPLHLASAKGYVRIAKLLLQYGANVSAAAQGGIRPLHEASENCHVEVIRLLLSYGADPLLGTYADQTPEELSEGLTSRFLRLHIADVQGKSVEPWRFPPPTKIIDYDELGCDPLCSPPPATPPPPPDSTIEIQCTEAPLPPFYTLRNVPGQTTDGLWCLLQDVTNLLQIKSKDSLLKQIHCGSGSPKELFREIRTQEFLERAQCHQLLCAGEKVNVRASKVALVRVTDKLRQLLKIETVLVS